VPVILGIVKLALYFAPMTLIKLNSCVEPLGILTLANTLSTAILSVTFAAISMLVLTLYVVPFAGRTSKTSGTELSLPTKKVIIVLLTLLLVSLAAN